MFTRSFAALRFGLKSDVPPALEHPGGVSDPALQKKLLKRAASGLCIRAR
jgi:hypothetical protein